MARAKGRKADDHDEKIDLILDKAAELFAQRGYPAASIADLAAACNCSKALIYHYAANKETILYTLLHRHIDHLIDVQRRTLAASDDARQQFHALVGNNLAVYARAPHKHTVLMKEIEHLQPHLRAELAEMQRELVEGVAALLARLNPRLATDKRLAKPFAMMFYGMINWTYTWYDPEGPVALPELVPLAANLFLDGLLAAPQPANAPR